MAAIKGVRQNRPERCYAIRRVNPFLGVMQIIESPAGRAVSANGVVWDIEVSAERKSGWGSLAATEVAYIRYGLWSADDGLVNRPLTPNITNDPLADQCREIIDALERNVACVPFQLQDSEELWLMDSDGVTPIALLASGLPGHNRPSPLPRYWSASIGADGVPSQRRFEHTEKLQGMVRQRAGFNLTRNWVERQADGSGRLMDVEGAVSAEYFPEMLLTTQWPEQHQVELVKEFLGWIAPALLTLQNLDDARRALIEKSLSIQAISVEHHWQLYPKIISERLVKSARIQGRLQNF